jgi:hypothetical protein
VILVKKRTIVLVIIGIVVWGLFFIVLKNKEKETNYSNTAQYVIIDNFYYWKYQKLQWQVLDNILDPTSTATEINWKNYDVYVDNKYLNTYKYVLMNDKSYFFDNDDNEIDVSETNILLSKNSNFNLKKFNEISFDDNDYNIVKNILNNKNYNYNDLTIKKKYTIATNNNIYILSNYDGLNNDIDESSIYYIVFLRINKKNYILVDTTYSELAYNYDLAYVLNINNNKINNIILSYTCDEDICYDMYQYNDNKFEKVIGSSYE